jgi:hypothetical protein
VHTSVFSCPYDISKGKSGKGRYVRDDHNHCAVFQSFRMIFEAVTYAYG